jgi:Putative Ig domain
MKNLSLLLALATIFVLSSCGSSSAPVSVKLSPSAAQAIDQGQQVSFTASVANDSTSAGVTWACSGAACTALTGVSTTSATFGATGTTGTATITATSIKLITASSSVTVTVTAAPAISTTQAQVTAAPATGGVAYNLALAATGGAGTLTWSATGLSDGLSINSSTGAISGTPTAKGTVTFTVTVTDASTAGPKTASAPFTITVNNPAPPAITTTQAQVTAAPAIAGSVYGFTFHASGTGALTWSAVGLPADALSLAAITGIVAGTPTSKATVSFTLTVSDSFGQSSAATPFTITVNNPAAPAITTTQAQVTAAPGTIGTAYSLTFHAIGTGALTWSAVGLPADALSLVASTGVVSGTPTSKTTVSFTLTASDTFGQSSAATPFTITVNNPAPPVISTTPAQVPSATVNVAYNFTFQGSGFAPLTWSTTPALSDGLSMSSTGVVTGTPTTATTLTFSVSLTDGLGQVTTVSGFSIVVSTESIAFTPAAPSTVTAGGTLSVNATVSGDAGNGGVNWSVTCGSAACGSFTASHTASGTATTYNAPAQPPTGGTVTITATAADAPSPQVSAVVTVNAQPLVFTTSSLPSGTVNTAYSATITASGGVAPYTFSLDAASSALPAPLQFNPGSPSATITGTPTATSTTNNIIVDVKDSEATPMTATVTFSLTINAVSAACGSGSESLLKGQYAMTLRGFDGSGPVGIGATFDADGAGHIAKLVGIEDINTTAGIGPQLDLSITSGSSSYSVGSDHRGCMTIVNSAGITQVFRFSLNAISAGVASNGHIIEFDGTGSNTAGVLRKQNTADFSTAQISGNFAFGVSGPEIGGGKFAAVGMLSLNGGGGFNASPTSVVDFNDNGNVDNNGLVYPASPISLSQGAYTISSASGRGTLSFLPGGGGASTVHAIVYVVSSAELLILSSDSQVGNNLFVGSALQQTVASFSGSSLNAASVLYTTGLGNNGGTAVSRVSAGIFTPSGGVNFSFSGQQNSGGTTSTQSATGTYIVASDGRVTLAGGGGGGAPIIYLVSANKGLALFTDGSTPGHVESGFLEPQTGGPFSVSSTDTTYVFGTIQPDVLGIDQSSGVVTFNGAGSIAGISDDNSSGTLNANKTFTGGTYSTDSTGQGLIPAGCTVGTTCNNIFFLISPTRLVLLDTSNDTNPDLEIVEQ